VPDFATAGKERRPKVQAVWERADSMCGCCIRHLAFFEAWCQGPVCIEFFWGIPFCNAEPSAQINTLRFIKLNVNALSAWQFF
jgi:hypothetical protein